MACPKKSSPVFHFFPRLPPELRLITWEFAANASWPHRVKVNACMERDYEPGQGAGYDPKLGGVVTKFIEMSPLFLACQDSRDVLVKDKVIEGMLPFPRLPDVMIGMRLNDVAINMYGLYSPFIPKEQRMRLIGTPQIIELEKEYKLEAICATTYIKPVINSVMIKLETSDPMSETTERKLAWESAEFLEIEMIEGAIEAFSRISQSLDDEAFLSKVIEIPGPEWLDILVAWPRMLPRTREASEADHHQDGDEEDQHQDGDEEDQHQDNDEEYALHIQIGSFAKVLEELPQKID
ncbi:hypothetical protein AB5N19_01661 [Seiridium cardinale]